MGETVKYRVGICGASGFVGSNLAGRLTQWGYTVVPLGRELLEEDASEHLAEAVAGCDVVINVAGVTIDHRWGKRYKQLLYDSRAGVARKLVEAIGRSERVQCWICVSAVGYYPSEGCYDESACLPGEDFLAGLCRAWETEAFRAPERVRTAVTRFGVVMAPSGGAFGKLSQPAKLGVAVETGSGRQPFTWIDIEDLCRAMEWVMLSQSQGGIFNFTAPQRLTQHEAVQLIQRHYRAKFRIRVPAFLLRLVRGEAADFLVKGQCALPARLVEAGFEFHSPDFETFLRRLL